MLRGILQFTKILKDLYFLGTYNRSLRYILEKVALMSV